MYEVLCIKIFGIGFYLNDRFHEVAPISGMILVFRFNFNVFIEVHV